jgi:hypothetical protein
MTTTAPGHTPPLGAGWLIICAHVSALCAPFRIRSIARNRAVARFLLSTLLGHPRVLAGPQSSPSNPSGRYKIMVE